MAGPFKEVYGFGIFDNGSFSDELVNGGYGRELGARVIELAFSTYFHNLFIRVSLRMAQVQLPSNHTS